MARRPDPGEVREFFRGAIWEEAIMPTLQSLRERGRDQVAALRPSEERDFHHAVGLLQGRLAQIDATLNGLEEAVLGWMKENS